MTNNITITTTYNMEQNIVNYKGQRQKHAGKTS